MSARVICPRLVMVVPASREARPGGAAFEEGLAVRGGVLGGRQAGAVAVGVARAALGGAPAGRARYAMPAAVPITVRHTLKIPSAIAAVARPRPPSRPSAREISLRAIRPSTTPRAPPTPRKQTKPDRLAMNAKIDVPLVFASCSGAESASGGRSMGEV